MFKKIFQTIKDYLFPVFCVDCGKEGEWWCKNCRKNFSFSPTSCCPFCRRANKGETCLTCKDGVFLDGASSFFKYEENNAAGRLLRLLKYSSAFDSFSVWQEIIAEKSACLVDGLSFFEHQTIFLVPVPLYPRRQRERGFNQSVLIGQTLLAVLSTVRPQTKFVFSERLLKRIRQTKNQASLSRQKRRENIREAFVVEKEENFPKNVLLVDDVFTTTATLDECARVLKEKGIEQVWAITLGRAI